MTPEATMAHDDLPPEFSLCQDLTEQQWAKRRVALRHAKSPHACWLLEAVQSVVNTIDAINGLRAGDLVVGSDDGVPCETERGVPIGGLEIRAANLDGAATRAATILRRASVEAEGLLRDAVAANREGCPVCGTGVDKL